MSGETTTTTLNDITYSAWIEAAFLDYSYDWVVAQQLFSRRYSLVGRPSNTISIPRITTDMGTVGDTGTGVATAFDGTEGSDLSNTALDTEAVTVAVSEYALLRTITDDVGEDSVNGLDLMQAVLQDAARILMTALEDDCVGLFGSLSNSVGSTGVDLTIAVALAAHVGIRKRGYRAPDGCAYVLDEEAVDHLEAALIASSTSATTYAAAADKLLGVDRTANNGMGNGHVMNFRGFPVYASGLTDTINGGEDTGSACFVPDSPGNAPHVTYALVDKRPFRVEQQRDASLRANEWVFSMRSGAGEVSDGSGTLIVSDA